ncbi:hypothetical protein GCM10023321_28940 [Pseudonocardia eucalypti]|uniref:DUF4229 domain-containing protein n=1 Tax=Pseudonocardia eucalypti TaxID=648755 RepID=A0ABP9Q2P4_9PSEU|nr:hypothetical protein [Pseudonocardia eucalypti]
MSPEATPRPLGAAVARYGLARVALVALVTAPLTWLGVPFLVALLVGLVASVPLSMLLLGGPRADLDAALAWSGRRRGEQRARLRAQLRGEAVDALPPTEPSAGPSAQGEADAGADGPGQHDYSGRAEHRD